MITSDCPFFYVNTSGEAVINIRQGDRVDGDTVASINLGDAMDAAEHLVRMYLTQTTNTRMGASEANQARKLKAIRKAMGYTYG